MAHLLAVRSFSDFNFIYKYYMGKISIKKLILKSLYSKKFYIEKMNLIKKRENF